MSTNQVVARALASAFLGGPFDEEALVRRGAQVLGKRWRWLRPLARRVLATFAVGAPPRRDRLARFILGDAGFSLGPTRVEPRLAGHPTRPACAPRFRGDTAPPGTGPLPELGSLGQLADWLSLSAGELDWFADRRGWEAAADRAALRHYHYRPLTKRFGRVRLIEAPKPRLKRLQRRILIEIIDQVPLHPAAHGFRRHRSVRTFAEPHVHRGVLLRIDLEDFFPSIRAARIQALFRSLGYPENVADRLAGLCTNTAPQTIWDALDSDQGYDDLARAARRYGQPHLPQGAPTSPALANLCAYRLDGRLAALAKAAGATYTRYADDLAFSGDASFARVVHRFRHHVAAVAIDEGFRVHHRKTRVMRPGVCQRLAGLVVNQRLNVARGDFDQLKAVLTNCARHGPAGQNRAGVADFRGHLLGRISFVAMIHPARGAKLRALFDRIAW